MLEGLVFDTTVPEGLRFATSICYPRSDLYIPLVIIIDSNGKMSVQKDQILDASESEDDGEGN
jgi:acetyl-CoA carboxylase alpha subunit